MADYSKTSAPQSAPEHTSAWQQALTLALLVLVSVNLRTAMLGVPPILPLLRHDLHLTYTETGLITALPTLVMGAAAIPVGLLVGRLGGRAMVAFGLLLLTAGTFLRAFWPAILPFYFFTALLGLGSSFAQISIPALIRQWFPGRIGFASALYSDGLVLGETLGAVLTLPLMTGWLGQNAWGASFIFWSVPTLIALVLWLWLAPPISHSVPETRSQAQPASAQSASTVASNAPTTPTKPARTNAWILGLVLGCVQLIYFGMNAWISSYNVEIHATALTGLALGTLNAAQLPAALLVTFFAERLVGRRAPFIVAGALCLVAVVGWVWAPAILEPLWAALLGGLSISVYSLAIALPALHARRKEVAKLTGKMMAIGYLFSFLGPFVGGWLQDLTHISAIVFLPIACASALLLVLAFSL